MPNNNILLQHDAIQAAKDGKIDGVKKYMKSLSNTELIGAMYGAIEGAAGNSASWMSEFNTSFNKTYGSDIKFKALNSDEKAKLAKYTTTAHEVDTGLSALTDQIQTNILPAVEGLIKDTTILKEVNVIEGVDNARLPEFNVETIAEQMAETAAGTPADQTPDAGDLLTAENKIQASTRVSDLAIRTLNATTYGEMLARLIRSVAYQIESQVFNGTNAGNQFAGILGTDATYGAITKTPAAGAAQNHVDAVELLISELPNNVSQAELAAFGVYANRKTLHKIYRTMDLNNRYYTGDKTPVSGIKYGMYNSIADDKVVLANLANYKVLLGKAITLSNDGGYSDFLNGQVVVKADTYADGGMSMGRKNTEAKNAFRAFDLKADYSV